jgi:transcriptional regulator with XRE-family HTH domain
MARARSRNPDDDPGAYLGSFLTQWRTSGSFPSQEALAPRLGVGRTRITKAETGEEPPDIRLLADWLRECKIPAEQLIEVVCALARHREETIPTWFRDFPDVEKAAHAILSWHTMVWPGLVQTAEYARALSKVMGHNAEVSERQAATRTQRQEILDGPHPPELVVVVDASVVHRLVGTREVTHGQLARVLELAERDTVSVNIVPEGVNAGHVGAFTLASVSGKPDVLLYEGMKDTVTTSPTMIASARRTWERIRSTALPASESIRLIREVSEK